MASHILAFVLQTGIQTAFLTLALWIMIKAQSLNFHFLGVLGTAALVSAIDEGFNCTVGQFAGTCLTEEISTPVVVAVLFFCLKKVTQADKSDIYFTVGVGYALVLVMNLWLIGMLMGNLRHSARPSLARETNAAEMAETATPAIETNKPTVASAKAVAAAPAVATNAPAKPVASLAELFSVKGVVRMGGKSSVCLQAGNQPFNLSLGESMSVQMTNGAAQVRFKELRENDVLLTINGVDSSVATPY